MVIVTGAMFRWRVTSIRVARIGERELGPDFPEFPYSPVHTVASMARKEQEIFAGAGIPIQTGNLRSPGDILGWLLG